MSARSGARGFALLFVLPVLLIGVSRAAHAGQGGGEVRVHRVTLHGVHGVDAAKLRAVIATRQGSRLPWGRQRTFDERTLEADVRRIQSYYADRGFPDARVAPPERNYNRQNTTVDIVITIDEGSPVRVAAIDLVGFDVIPPDHLDRIRADMPMRTDHPRDRALIQSSRDIALNELRDQGYPYARVGVTEVPGADSSEVTLRFAAEPGVLAHFGEIQITGNKSVGENIIRRQIDYRAGDLYRRSVLQNTQRRLYGLALFQFVNVVAVNPDAQSPDVRTQVSVTEGKHQRVNAGIGYGSEDKARVDGEYRHVNFFGGARSAGVHGRWSSYDRGVRADFTQPYFFQAHLSLGGETQRWYTDAPAYNSIVTGGRLAVTHRSGPATSVSVSITGEKNLTAVKDNVIGQQKLVNDLIALGLDPTTGKQEGTLAAVGFEVTHQHTDNVLNPRRGYQVSFHGEEAGVALPGSFSYYSLAGDGRHYQPVGNRLVVATHLQMGNIGPVGEADTHVPFAKKYFLGGATTLRGWGRYEVSPLSSSGIPLGGNSFLAFSAEGRADIGGSFGVVLFLDAGNVWQTSAGFALNDLRYDVGPGFRYRTPVGPIRFDVGYQLNQVSGLVDKDGNPSTSRLRFNFSIGEAF